MPKTQNSLGKRPARIGEPLRTEWHGLRLERLRPAAGRGEASPFHPERLRLAAGRGEASPFRVSWAASPCALASVPRPNHCALSSLQPSGFQVFRLFLPALLSCLFLLPGKLTAQPPPNHDYHVAAYIWPSCHDDPVGRAKLWPEGIGEWEVIKKGNPRYEGHYQPKQPLWGYEMDNDPKVVEKWINAATDHGVNIFIYDWYWYDGGPFLESALNDGFLKAANNHKMQFYIMWANHDVKKNFWNYHLYKDDDSLLWDAAVDWENYKKIVARVIKQYFHKPNYYKIDGKPVFSIYELRKLKASFGGGDEEIRKALDYFNEEAKKAGFPGIHFQLVARPRDATKEAAERIEALGFNSVTLYTMGSKSAGRGEDYLAYGTLSIKNRADFDKVLNIPFFPCVGVGWDDTPRFPKYGKKDTVHYNNTPESFAALLSKAKQYLDQRPGQPKLITINAWNEWVEGSYLLPDMKHGFSYLEAVRDAITGKYNRYDHAPLRRSSETEN